MPDSFALLPGAGRPVRPSAKARLRRAGSFDLYRCTRVVVKLMFEAAEGRLQPSSSAGESELGDLVLQTLEIESARSRVVPESSPEFRMVAEILKPAEAWKKRSLVPPKREGDEQDPFGTQRQLAQSFEMTSTAAAKAFKIMEAVQGESLSALSEGHKTDDGERAVSVADVDRLAAVVLQNGEKIGALVVADAIIGNTDRIGKGRANIGNIMVHEGTGKFIAIDTGSSLPQIEISDPSDMEWEKSLEAVVAPGGLDGIIMTFLSVIEGTLRHTRPDPTTFDPVARFKAKLDLAAPQSAVRVGVSTAIVKRTRSCWPPVRHVDSSSPNPRPATMRGELTERRTRACLRTWHTCTRMRAL
jgi:hypothetical protein